MRRVTHPRSACRSGADVRRAWVSAPVFVVLALGFRPALGAGDPAAAERQYRVARRLVAEGSAEAAAALRRVTEIDPTGPLADDALVEQALLERPARWPEDLGGIAEAPVRRALDLLQRVQREMPNADRSAEARYLRALLLLEPLPLYDASKARVDLAAVAASGSASTWAGAARYSAAWLAEQSGSTARAADAYGRLLVDAPGSEAASRARVAAARIALRAGDPGRAAALAQSAVDAGAAPRLGSESLRALALAALGDPRTIGAGPADRTPTGTRNLSGFAPTALGVLVGDARSSSIQSLGSAGSGAHWTLDALQAIAVDALGRMYAAAGDRLYRLAADGTASPLASQGDFTPVTGLAADAAGRLWVLDRKRERIGRVDPGAKVPVTAWTRPGARLLGLTWDGSRVVTVDAKERLLLHAEIGGGLETAALGAVQKPATFATDAAGQVVVLDERDDSMHLLRADGTERAKLDMKALGLVRAEALAVQPDGSISVFDASDGAWVRLR